MNIKLQSGDVVTEQEFRESFPNVILPHPLTAEILAEQGASIEPEAPEVPQSVSRAQGQAALHHEGYLEAVESYMSTAPMLEKIAYSANEWRRASPMLQKMALLLGLSSAQLDGLFVIGAAYEF